MEVQSRKRDLTPVLEKIRASVNILEVIGEHVVLRRSGANYTGLCPFHSERSPSFSVSDTKQLFHCYGCKKGGDLITFVMEMGGLGFIEAVEDLAERAKISPQELGLQDASGQSNQLRVKQATAYKLNRFVAAYFHKTLLADEAAQSYANRRGLSASQIQEYYVGFATHAWEGLASHLATAKAPIDLAQELGLIRPSQKGQNATGYFDLFRNRIIFPILNLRGKVVGFGGRSIGDETPKYLNSPESLIFHKGKLAFGLYQAQKYIREKDEVILVEGYFDVLALQAAGFQNVVSTCGTALTASHLKIFSRLASRIVILFDGDRAGVDATERAMETGLEAGQILFGAAMPADMDPDELVIDPNTGKPFENAKERVQEILAKARPLLDARIQEVMASGRTSPEGRVQALKRIGHWLNRLADPVGRAVREQWVEKEMGISKAVILGPEQRLPAIRSRPQAPLPSQLAPQVSAADRMVLHVLATGEGQSAYFQNLSSLLPPGQTPLDLLDSPLAREAVRWLLHAGPGFEAAPANMGGLDPELQSLLSEAWVVEKESGGEISSEDFRVHLMKRAGKIWARVSHALRVAIQEAEANKNADLQDQLMKEYLDVQRKMKDFNNFYDEE